MTLHVAASYLCLHPGSRLQYCKMNTFFPQEAPAAAGAPVSAPTDVETVIQKAEAVAAAAHEVAAAPMETDSAEVANGAVAGVNGST